MKPILGQDHLRSSRDMYVPKLCSSDLANSPDHQQKNTPQLSTFSCPCFHNLFHKNTRPPVVSCCLAAHSHSQTSLPELGRDGGLPARCTARCETARRSASNARCETLSIESSGGTGRFQLSCLPMPNLCQICPSGSQMSIYHLSLPTVGRFFQ